MNHLPVSAVIGGEIFAVPGGLSPDLSYVDQIQALDRFKEMPFEGILCDLAWSDPCDMIKGFSFSHMGAGWRFGSNIVQEFNHLNGL